MYPSVGRDLLRFRQLDHVYRRRMASLAARAAFQRSLELPERSVFGAADGIERQARPRPAAIAFDFQPAEPAVETLPDRRRRLGGPAITFHADRPGLGFRAVG